MGIAALIMAGSVFLSRLMGLVRDKVVSWQFGAGGESDVYFAAFVVPDFLNYLLAGGYISITLIPLLSKRFEEDEADGWRFFSAVFCTMVSPILCCAPSMVRTQGLPAIFSVIVSLSFIFNYSKEQYIYLSPAPVG